jgi:uncharacterized protein YndB with AHSA1/START domain
MMLLMSRKPRSIERPLVEIRAPPAKIWSALTKPGQLGLWWPVVASIDARAGGRFGFEWGCSLRAVGEVLEAKPRERLVLSYTIPELASGRRPTRISFVLERRAGTPLTYLYLSHTGFSRSKRDDEYFLSHVEGWDVDLAELANVAETGAPGSVAIARAEVTVEPVTLLERVAKRLAAPCRVVAGTGQVRVDLGDSSARLRIDDDSRKREVTVVERSPDPRADEAAVHERWRRALRGSVRGLTWGTVYS